MMFRNSCVHVVFILLFTLVQVHAQTTRVIPASGNTTTSSDTIPALSPDDPSLNQIIDIRKQFDKQNRTYSVPARPSSDLLRFIKKDEPTISPEALYWARLVRDASTIFSYNMTFRDTIIADPIFITPLFRGNVLPDDFTFFHKDSLYPKDKDPYASLYKPDTTVFAQLKMKKKVNDMLWDNLERNSLDLYKYSVRDLPGETIKTSYIRKPIDENISLKVEPEISFTDLEAPAKFIPDRLYWRSAFESAIQFSQNYISPNWHKGGASNLNLFTKNHLKYDYNKDKIQFTNELELKVSFYNAPNDTIRKYKIGEDLLRYHTNFGYKAFNKWYYTLDGEFKTQMFKNYKENEDMVQAAFLAPFSINLGIGMKYDLTKQFKKNKHKKLTLSVNLAPASYTFMYSIKKDSLMDLARHGFEERIDPPVGRDENRFKHALSRFGSTIRADMTMNFNRNISWQSRVYYFTTYENVVAEFENTLVMAITRHFSTRIYAHIRYDDSVAKNPDFDSHFQINQMLSFGFNYKW